MLLISVPEKEIRDISIYSISTHEKDRSGKALAVEITDEVMHPEDTSEYDVLSSSEWPTGGVDFYVKTSSNYGYDFDMMLEDIFDELNEGKVSKYAPKKIGRVVKKLWDNIKDGIDEKYAWSLLSPDEEHIYIVTFTDPVDIPHEVAQFFVMLSRDFYYAEDMYELCQYFDLDYDSFTSGEEMEEAMCDAANFHRINTNNN